MASATNITVPQYAATMGKAVAGQLFGNKHVVLVKEVADSAGIAFGSPLFVQSTNGHQVKATDSTKALPFAGIAGFTQKTMGLYEQYEPINAVVKGMIYVEIASSSIAENEKVYVKYADGKFYSATDVAAGTAADFCDINAIALEAGAAANEIVPILLG